MPGCPSGGSARTALLDWDGTLRRGYMIPDWAHFLVRRGVIPPRVHTHLQALFAGYRTGRVSYEWLAQEASVVLATGLSGAAAEELLLLGEEFAAQDLHRLRPFAAPLVEALRGAGVRVVVVSGSPYEPLQAQARNLSITDVFSLRLEIVNGICTGRVLTNPGLRATKQAIRDSVAAQSSVVLAAGDSPADRAILNGALVPVVVGRTLDAMGLGAIRVSGQRADARRIMAALNALGARERPRVPSARLRP
jgi:phosphoserine phosphatase